MTNKSLTFKITVAAYALILLCSLLIGGISYWLFRSESIEMHAKEAQILARTLTAVLSGDHLEHSMQTREQDAQYLETKIKLDNIKAETGIADLYVLDKNAVYYMQGAAAQDNFPARGLGDRETEATFREELYQTLAEGQGRYTADMYRFEHYGMVVSAFEPLRNSAGQVVGVVGIDVGAEQINAFIHLFLKRLFLGVLLFCVASGAVVRWLILCLVGRPISDIAFASDKLALGETDVDVSHIHSGSEIGRLAQSFQHMVEATRDQAEHLRAISQGDLRMAVPLRSEQDTISRAINNTLDRLNEMFLELLIASQQVNYAAQQMADGAQMLAAGASEQAASVQELSVSIEDIAEMTKRNADLAEQANAMAGNIRQSAVEGVAKMEQMTQSVAEITQASQSIERVIKAIDDIAFQTNILALNAAVEAARAGVHGKGFAVVADEVRSLASKSAAAAKETAELIAASIEKARHGTAISSETADSLHTIVEGINSSQSLIEHIAASAQSQKEAILQINLGIDQVSNVVQQNSATAEQSAAASEEMSTQASHLEALVSQYHLKGGLNAAQSPPIEYELSDAMMLRTEPIPEPETRRFGGAAGHSLVPPFPTPSADLL